jgi:hypothetical protein
MSADISTLKDVVSIARDVILAITAVVTGGVAIYGINSWRREASGKAKFEAAKSLLAAGYKVRDQIRMCRSPLIVAGEFSPDFPLGSEKKYEAYAHVYSNRWAPVKTALESFDSALIDGEAVFGDAVRAAAEGLRGCGRKLFAGIEGYLSNMREGGGGPRDELEVSFRRLIHSRPEDDTFAKELDSAVLVLQAFLSPHVQRAR